MSILDTSQDGTFVFVALQVDTTDERIFFKITRPTSTTPATVTAYEPTGTAAVMEGMTAKSGDPDIIFFHGWLGNDGIVRHDIAAATNTEVGENEQLSQLEVDPSDILHFVAYNSDDESFSETINGGTAWTELTGTTVAVPVDALDIIFLGEYFPFQTFWGGNDTVDENLEYSPNEFANQREDTSAALKAVGAIKSIGITLDV